MDTSYPASANLPRNAPLPASDDVARYCSPLQYDHKLKRPKIGAFIAGGNPPELSVNHLQFFKGYDRPAAVNCIRAELSNHLTLKRNGRFVVLKVANIRDKARQLGANVSIIYTLEPDKPSHASICMPTDHDMHRIATMLMRLAARVDVYDATT